MRQHHYKKRKLPQNSGDLRHGEPKIDLSLPRSMHQRHEHLLVDALNLAHGFLDLSGPSRIPLGLKPLIYPLAGVALLF